MRTPTDRTTAVVKAAVSTVSDLFLVAETVEPLMLWLVLLGIVLVAVAVCLYFQHPGVRATRALRASMKQGNQQREEIQRATEATKAEMDRIAREWKDRR